MNAFLLTVMMIAGLAFSGCADNGPDTELPWTFAPGITDKSVYNGSEDEIRAKTALEVTGAQDPLLALDYRLDNAYGPFFFDYVVLTWAKMTVKAGDGGTLTFGLDLSAIQGILDAKSTKIAPLQAKGIKVLLGVTNSGGGMTFANLPHGYRPVFAKIIKDTLDRYGLNGLEFNDEGGGDGAYPYLGLASYYDPRSDYETVPADDGGRVSVGSAQQALDYWREGAKNYAHFLTFFRKQEHDIGNSLTIIGAYDDNPVIVREAGFAGGEGDTNYMDQRVVDWLDPALEFISVTDQVNFYLSVTTPPFSASSGSFGWNGTGASVMRSFATHKFYCPGLIDLSAVTDADLAYFGERFGGANLGYAAGQSDLDAGYAYGLVYFTNLTEGNDETAAKLSALSKWVYGPRDTATGFEVNTSGGPQVLYVK